MEGYELHRNYSIILSLFSCPQHLDIQSSIELSFSSGALPRSLSNFSVLSCQCIIFSMGSKGISYRIIFLSFFFYFLFFTSGASIEECLNHKVGILFLYFVLLMKSHLQSYPCPLQINTFMSDLGTVMPGPSFRSSFSNHQKLQMEMGLSYNSFLLHLVFYYRKLYSFFIF